MSAQTRVLFSRRAILDLDEIERTSIDQWGEQVAEAYLADIDRAIQTIREYPDLLRERPVISPHFSFYPIRSHVMVCTQIKGVICILTFKHGSMSLCDRLLDLEPYLLREAEYLYKQASDSFDASDSDRD